MHWIQQLHNRTSIFTKVLVANAAIVLVGTLLTVSFVTRVWRGGQLNPVAEGAVILLGLVISLGVNYAILRLAFVPLFVLQSTFDRVRQGDFSARVPEVQGDPDIARVNETANLMLDRLEEHRQTVSAQILQAMEDERKRIARELHDETSQSITSLLINLELVRQHLPEQSELQERIRITKEIAQRTLDETRRLMLDLRPSVLDDLGLVPALRWFVSQRVQPLGLPVDFQVAGLDRRLSEQLETALFRIMQEAITNAVKHAKAQQLKVQLKRSSGRIIGIVQDDGIGFTADKPAGRSSEERGYGLFGMQERAALVGGSVKLESAPGKGTTVRVSVPEKQGVKGAVD